MKGRDSGKKEQLAEMFKRQAVAAPAVDKRKRAEFDKLMKDLDGSLQAQYNELLSLKKEINSGEVCEACRKERDFFCMVEKKREEVKRELDELHKTLGEYEDRVRYKDEAERELQGLEEINLMLRSKLKEMIGGLEKLKVRKGANLQKLFSEAKGLDEEVDRTGEEVLDFEREYAKFLGMMRKLSG
ncbi:MAG: hypothetical protein Sv326_0663 [Candidatus Fermentimicrarchaeum limneticum]|uniref:Uncharacterized protein n=1 Tax=Fermentimicrarchaeum limneticum TaxID=2795018 RepID=A0A7D6BLY5_FERL1|nr:MAG: hypothetical protein Sv326_0663 [Candidatus Fermentimicrarchaeum limneticum]